MKSNEHPLASWFTLLNINIEQVSKTARSRVTNFPEKGDEILLLLSEELQVVMHEFQREINNVAIPQY
ncbi:hypothetical protein [Mucilaginibacter sp.]|uniref:hypothetical protein n=1 Tax=Mucilaginibacter sp. TaxID=1882438 RepID=UPI0035BC788D